MLGIELWNFKNMEYIYEIYLFVLKYGYVSNLRQIFHLFNGIFIQNCEILLFFFYNYKRERYKMLGKYKFVYKKIVYIYIVFLTIIFLVGFLMFIL